MTFLSYPIISRYSYLVEEIAGEQPYNDGGGSVTTMVVTAHKNSVSPDSRSEAVRKYFTKTPIEPTCPVYSGIQTRIGIGYGMLVIALCCLLSLKTVPVILGLIAFCAGLNLVLPSSNIYKKIKQQYQRDQERYTQDYEQDEPKPSDAEMDQWLADDIEKMVQTAARRLGLSAPDIVSSRCILGGPSPALKEIRYAIGTDGKIRYSHFDILIVFLTDHHLASYESRNSLLSGKVLSDSTKEFPYKEITSFGTRTIKQSIPLSNRDERTLEEEALEFTLATSGSNVIQIVYSSPHSSDRDSRLMPIGDEATIGAIRKKLEEYKKTYE